MNFLRVFVILAFFLGFSTGAFAAASVGKVLAVEGTAKANDRKLSRGSSVFVSDVIDVASSSKIQIRFTDGGILNLIESTQYRIDSYQFSASSGSGSSSAELIKGGFRSVSGSIAKNNPDKYSVNTPVAIVGVRGTLFEANIKRGETFFGCDSGMIRVYNKSGERELNAGEFVSARSQNMLGQVTDVRPAALANTLFTAPEGGVSQEQVEQNPESGGAEEEQGAEGEEGEEEEVEDVDVSESEGNPPC